MKKESRLSVFGAIIVLMAYGRLYRHAAAAATVPLKNKAS
ncbi:hypothetical protein BJQ97_01553 [Geobacillus sp. TFV-3]|nr:hypothetical protein BJQ97_01553 [Geobacillus sp. TFV-3]